MFTSDTLPSCFVAKICSLASIYHYPPFLVATIIVSKNQTENFTFSHRASIRRNKLTVIGILPDYLDDLIKNS